MIVNVEKEQERVFFLLAPFVRPVLVVGSLRGIVVEIVLVVVAHAPKLLVYLLRRVVADPPQAIEGAVLALLVLERLGTLDCLA